MTNEQLSEAKRLCEAATAVSDSLGFCPDCDYGFGAAKEHIMWNGLCCDCHQQWFSRESKRLLLALLDAYQQSFLDAQKTCDDQLDRRAVLTQSLMAERDRLRAVMSSVLHEITIANVVVLVPELVTDRLLWCKSALSDALKRPEAQR